MRVLQLIDSLDGGGAERVAITFANALASTATTDFSAIAATRKEGLLKKTISERVEYTFVNKKKTLDFSALLRLRKFVCLHNIQIVHAHTTSFFFATLLKIVCPNITLFWHEHLGSRVEMSRSENKTLYFCSFFFKGIITVNSELKNWCLQNLATKKVMYLPNFVLLDTFEAIRNHKEKVIVCLANLRSPKNHLNLLEAFRIVHHQHQDWQLQLIGKDSNDLYSESLKQYVAEHGLSKVVEFTGSVSSVDKYLNRASIGVLSSDSEGLPMALLEYGGAGLAVVTTNVGYCKEVIQDTGRVVAVKDSQQLAAALIDYIENDTLRKKDGAAFRNQVEARYSLKAVLPELLKFYKS
ncbi:glycosyltransferase family 4 protein [Cochleicola gelatinilyticus]|uniref:Glycosyltransferase n=1 Tax=Cochleicola gelatinilyticus TaxID=1763537 RepID=A0A167ENY7_9FLAO|nr:glycosyltransferase family 4 protein [Cochleicola gelatinilyticus]OAB75729.1 hypothetical protein ULVI_14740 [Cochleicola gelatinilyticus]